MTLAPGTRVRLVGRFASEIGEDSPLRELVLARPAEDGLVVVLDEDGQEHRWHPANLEENPDPPRRPTRAERREAIAEVIRTRIDRSLAPAADPAIAEIREWLRRRGSDPATESAARDVAQWVREAEGR